MSALSPAMRNALSRRAAGTEDRPRMIVHEGVAYHAEAPGDWLTISERGLVYLHTPNIDVVLNGVEFPRYEHDGQGGVALHGNMPRPVTMSLEQALARFEHIEAWRARMADYPSEASKADKCMASLLKATDDAERWAGRQEARP